MNFHVLFYFKEVKLLSLVSTKKITLDFYNKNIVTVNAKQNDSQSRQLNVACTDSGKKVRLEAKDETAFIRYTKNDGNKIFNHADILEDGTILIEFTEQMLAVVGKQEIEIVLISLGDMTQEELDDIYAIYEHGCTVISTMTFYLNVMPAMADVSVIASTEEYTSLSRALTTLTYLGQLQGTMDATEAAIMVAHDSINVANDATEQANAALEKANGATSVANDAFDEAYRLSEDMREKMNSGEWLSRTTDRGKPDGVASLDASGIIPLEQINAPRFIKNSLTYKSTGYALDASKGAELKTQLDKLPMIHYNDVVDDSIGVDGDVLLVPVS